MILRIVNVIRSTESIVVDGSAYVDTVAVLWDMVSWIAGLNEDEEPGVAIMPYSYFTAGQ